MLKGDQLVALVGEDIAGALSSMCKKMGEQVISHGLPQWMSDWVGELYRT